MEPLIMGLPLLLSFGLLSVLILYLMMGPGIFLVLLLALLVGLRHFLRAGRRASSSGKVL